MDKQMGPDLLSDLPLGIIHIILSFLPIREAIGTSFLSKQWRYVWTSLPHLAFDVERDDGERVDDERDDLLIPISDIKKLIDFVSQVLVLHEGPIYKFEVRFPSIAMSRAQFPFINQWMLFLSANSIRVLVLQFDYMDRGIEILSSLYSFQNLTYLELHLHSIPPPPPSFEGFLFLRSLGIFSGNVDSTTVETIVAHSPLLEELKLRGSRCSELTIRAPNLKFFCFGHESIHLSLCTPLLEELKLDIMYMTNFSFHESLVFHHLRSIELCGVCFERAEEMMVVDRLITCSPNLQKLKITTFSSSGGDAQEHACVSFCDTESVPNFTYDSLKVIEMMIFGCGINEMKLIKFLLARAPVLERMIYVPYSLSEQELLDLTAELQGCRRASANAGIVIDECLC